MKFFKHILQRALSSILIFSLVFQGIILTLAPQEAHAQAASSASASLGAIAGTAVGCALGNITGGTGKFEELQSLSADKVPVTDVKVKAKVAAQERKESCLDAIAYTAAKVALKKVTLAQIAWINSGFKGNPLYPKNVASFFLSIAHDEINSITGVLTSDSALYPFGKDLARSIILSTQASFEVNAQYSLNKVLGNANAVRFQADFSAGGWDGWLSATQFLSNNPAGAHIQAADEVAYQLQGTAQTKAQEIRAQLLQAQGFLGLQKCVDPEGEKDFSKCKRLETVTPGAAIANQMNLTLGTSQRQLELADEMNESLSAVFDALINQLLGKGLASLSGTSTGGYDIGVYGGYGNNSNNNTINGGSSLVPDPDQWYNQNPTFNIWHDLQGIIDLQIDFKNFLWDKTFISIQDGKTYEGENYILKNKLLPSIYEFDFCVPGPNPLWKETADQRMDTFTNNIPTDPKQLPKVSQTLNNIFDPGHFSNALFDDSPEEKIDKVITPFFNDVWNLRVNRDGHLDDPSKGYALASQVYKEYQRYIADIYSVFSFSMPTVASDLPAIYRQVPVYEATVDDNDDAVAFRDSIIRKLQYIQAKVAAIPEDETKQTQTQKDDIKIYLRNIGRMAPDLGDDDTLEKLRDEVYTFDDLYDYLAGGATSLIAQCKTELADPNSSAHNMRGLRAVYPTDLLPQSVQDKYLGALGGYFKPVNQQDYGGSFLPGIYFGPNNFSSNPTHVLPDLSSYYAIPLNQQLFGPSGTPIYGGDGKPIYAPLGVWDITPPVDYAIVDPTYATIARQSNYSGFEAYIGIY